MDVLLVHSKQSFDEAVDHDRSALYVHRDKYSSMLRQ